MTTAGHTSPLQYHKDPEYIGKHPREYCVYRKGPSKTTTRADAIITGEAHGQRFLRRPLQSLWMQSYPGPEVALAVILGLALRLQNNCEEMNSEFIKQK